MDFFADRNIGIDDALIPNGDLVIVFKITHYDEYNGSAKAHELSHVQFNGVRSYDTAKIRGQDTEESAGGKIAAIPAVIGKSRKGRRTIDVVDLFPLDRTLRISDHLHGPVGRGEFQQIVDHTENPADYIWEKKGDSIQFIPWV
jgi:hypothetical protein